MVDPRPPIRTPVPASSLRPESGLPRVSANAATARPFGLLWTASHAPEIRKFQHQREPTTIPAPSARDPVSLRPNEVMAILEKIFFGRRSVSNSARTPLYL